MRQPGECNKKKQERRSRWHSSPFCAGSFYMCFIQYPNRINTQEVYKYKLRSLHWRLMVFFHLPHFPTHFVHCDYFARRPLTLWSLELLLIRWIPVRAQFVILDILCEGKDECLLGSCRQEREVRELNKMLFYLPKYTQEKSHSVRFCWQNTSWNSQLFEKLRNHHHRVLCAILCEFLLLMGNFLIGGTFSIFVRI